MKLYKDPIREKVYNWLISIFDKSDVTLLNNGASAPFVTILISNDKETIEITSFSESGKQYSGWYFVPSSFEAFSNRLNFNKSKLCGTQPST